jgi:hypothetical protein
MKKANLFYSLLTVASMALTACSADEFVVDGNGDGNVIITASLPAEFASRAFGDGLQATNLTYAVYDSEAAADTDPVILVTNASIADLKATVNLKLATGKTYNILFWADKPGNTYYTFDKAKQTITVDYTDAVQNADDRDAFFAVIKDLKVEGTVTQDVTLTRPFAQINFGTNDLNEAAVTNAYPNLGTALTAKAYKTLNLLSGEVSDEVDVAYKVTTPPDGETFPITGYSYLAMDYLLVPADRSVADVTFDVYNGEKKINTLDVTSMPVQRNYRTNVYGALLTSKVDFQVSIDPAFNPAAIIADGVSYDQATKTYYIENKAGLQWYADQTNVAKNDFSGCTVKLTADIDLNNEPWTPIAANLGFLKGVFDGQHHTVKNIKVTVDDKTPAGFFSYAFHVKNLKLENVDITGHYNVAGLVGYGIASHIDSCSVINGTINATPYRNSSGLWDDGNNVGGITGYLSPEDDANISNCKVSGLTITGYRKVGGLAGVVNLNAAVVENDTVINCKSIARMTVLNYDGVREAQVDEVTNVLESCTMSGIISEGNSTETITTATNVDLYDAQDLVYLSNYVNNTKATIINNEEEPVMSGVTVTLVNDIDMAGIDFTPIGIGTDNVASDGAYACYFYKFAGTFEGNGKTISNLTASDTRSPEVSAAGLFGTVIGRIQNLTLKNVHITSAHFAGGIAGYYNNNHGLISNCTVDGGVIESILKEYTSLNKDGNEVTAWDGGDKVGGILGFGLTTEDQIDGCTVKNVTLKGYRNMGSITGYIYNPATVSNNAAENVTIISDFAHNYKNFTSTAEAGVNEIVGYLSTAKGSTTENVTGNTASNVTITYLNTTFSD